MKLLIVKKNIMDEIVLFVNGVEKEKIIVWGETFSIRVEDNLGNVDTRRRDGTLGLSNRAVNKTLEVSDVWHDKGNVIISNNTK